MDETTTKLDSKWGNPRANQIKAGGWISAKKDVLIPEIKVFEKVVRPATTKEVVDGRIMSTEAGDVIPDDADCKREFLYRCGLLKALTLLGQDQSEMQLFLNGYSNVRLRSSSVVLQIDTGDNPDLETPIADVLFIGFGPRYGELRNYEARSITLWFKDRSQFDKYVTAVVPPPPPPKPSTNHHTTVVREESSSLIPLAVGAVLGLALFD